jgi:hypothetical protein
MKSALCCVDRGLFSCEEVFDPLEYVHIKGLLEDRVELGGLQKRPHAEDEDMDEHPDWSEDFPPFIENRLHEYINSTRIPQLFGFQNQI